MAYCPAKMGAPDTRIALVYYKLNAYVFTGEVEEQSSFAETDKLFVAAINSFRPISSREIAGQNPRPFIMLRLPAPPPLQVWPKP